MFQFQKKIFSKLFLISLAASLFACNPPVTTVTEDNSAEFTTILNDISQNVIVATYSDLKTEVEALHRSATAFQLNPNAENLELVRASWKKARSYWEQSEGFIFGPVETEGLDPKLDSWPVNKIDLDAVLNSSNSLNAAYIDALEGTMKGFHTIEYLIFGTIDNRKTFNKITQRELEYLLSCTENLKISATQLYNSWDSSGNNFVANFTKIGTQNSLYTSSNAAMQEILNGMITIVDEVGNGKIADPFKEQDRRLEESQFSDNSNQDFADNIRSVKNLYSGSYNGKYFKGISHYVTKKNPQLDNRIKQEIEEAITSIHQMQPTFGEAIFKNKSSVEKSQAAVIRLKHTLESELFGELFGK